jgi:hypothetical protein
MWIYNSEKAFPYECSACGCGHPFEQRYCDRCGAENSPRPTEMKTFRVDLEVEAYTQEDVNDWLLRYLMEEVGNIHDMRWSIEEESE